jgi:hypothetical protein
VRSSTGAKAPKGRSASRSSGGNGMSASDFVRSMPTDMPAKEVVAAGADKGIKLSANLVYMVRSSAKRKGVAGAAQPRGRGRSTQASSDVVAFKKMAFELGLERARQALDELEQALVAMLR